MNPTKSIMGDIKRVQRYQQTIKNVVKQYVKSPVVGRPMPKIVPKPITSKRLGFFHNSISSKKY